MPFPARISLSTWFLWLINLQFYLKFLIFKTFFTFFKKKSKIWSQSRQHFYQLWDSQTKKRAQLGPFKDARVLCLMGDKLFWRLTCYLVKEAATCFFPLALSWQTLAFNQWITTNAIQMRYPTEVDSADWISRSGIGWRNGMLIIII